MAITQTQTLPPKFIEDLATDYGAQLKATTAVPLKTAAFAPQVEGLDPYQTQAYTRAQTGIGAYEPYITGQGAYAGAPTDMRGAQDFMGPTGYQAFMSPYQQDVIDKTLAQYDVQAQKGLTGIGQLAAQSGNLGGGREGVMRSEYQSQSDLNRALLNAQMLQQGFGQAQAGAGQAFGQSMQMAGQIPQLYGQDTATLGQAGAMQQAQGQAVLDAQREAARMAAYEPYERLGQYGTGVTGIMGGYPGQYQSMVTPNPTPLQSALGIGSVLSGIWGNVTGKPNPAFPTQQGIYQP